MKISQEGRGVTPDQISQLHLFAKQCNFQQGMLVLDLDGTALLEDKGKIFISSSVEKGVKALHDLGRPVILNTLRFPMSVITSVGEAWYQIADIPILTILLNGSVLGYIKRSNGHLIYEELAAFPMRREEVLTMLNGIEELLRNGINDILFFYYTRDWAAGETLWTPDPNRVDGLRKKFVSASKVTSQKFEELKETLFKSDVCMASIFVDRPQDTLMAYQHSKRNSFFTRNGVDKAFGLRMIAERLNISLNDSIGAGDTEMDGFLNETGLSVIVGRAQLAFRGKISTIRVPDPMALGDLLIEFARVTAPAAKL
jgi:hydroxymethylpyrimidine pyrophosphatase-like HAD family hydrolase